MGYRDVKIGEISFVEDESNIIWGEVYPPDVEYGHLYVIEFDSGWVKVGKTSDWHTRLATHRREYRRCYGWSVVDDWSSCLVDNVRDGRSHSSDLCTIERRLLRYARTVSDRRQLNPRTPGVGRDKTRPSETELFHGCDFGVLRAYADALATNHASR